MAIGEFHSVALPWPSDPVPTTEQYQAAGAALDVSVSTTPTVEEKAQIDAIMGILSERIERYAPGAPLAIKREAAARYHGYVSEIEQPAGGDVQIGSLSQKPPYSHAAMFRYCGAAALLSPWRVRRAGVVKSEDDD